MTPNPLLGIPLHWLGGLASGSFYVPFRAVKRWSWETYWLTGAVFSCIICPLIFALILTQNLFSVIAAQSLSTLSWTYFFGLLWGFGGMSYGLTMRYLGISLGTGVALGFCAAFGTLIPPIFKLVVPTIPVAESITEIASSHSGQLTLMGVFICFLGIGISSLAGLKKEQELPVDAKKLSVAEFSFVKGMLVAIFCGIASACFAFALTAGNPINASSLNAGTAPLWTGLPKLVVLLWGGFTTTLVWCAILFRRNRSIAEYLPSRAHTAAGSCPDALANTPLVTQSELNEGSGLRLIRNYLFSAAAGTTWYLQFFFYTMGETQMGRYGFASWTVHMASIILFATMWGWLLHEWRGTSRTVHLILAAGLCVLLSSTVVVGWGAYVKAHGSSP